MAQTCPSVPGLSTSRGGLRELVACLLWPLFPDVGAWTSDAQVGGPPWRAVILGPAGRSSADQPAQRWGAALDSDWLASSLAYPEEKRLRGARTTHQTVRTAAEDGPVPWDPQERSPNLWGAVPGRPHSQGTSTRVSWRLQGVGRWGCCVQYQVQPGEVPSKVPGGPGRPGSSPWQLGDRRG